MAYEALLDPGRLNRLITIQQQTTTQAPSGQPLQSWSKYLECRASIETQNSQLIYATAEFVGKATYRITVWFNPRFVIQPNMRVHYINPADKVEHVYNIETVINDCQANRQTMLLCYEQNGSE